MKQTNLTNHFIIAMPSLEDINFSRSVTYICEHNDDGALGVTINRPSDIHLYEIFEQLKIQDYDQKNAQQIVYIGGPVQQERGFLLHRPNGNWSSSLKVTDNISITTSQDILQAMAKGEGPDDVLVTLGYAGWAAGQLERELSENTWLSCPATEEIIFATPAEKRWEAAARLLGVDLSLLSHDAGHA